MEDYDVVLARTVQEWLLEREPNERESLLKTIWEELKVSDTRTVSLPMGYKRRELLGYLVDYRELSEDEEARFRVRAGHLIAWIADVPSAAVEWLSRDPYRRREASRLADPPAGPTAALPPPPGPPFTPPAPPRPRGKW